MPGLRKQKTYDWRDSNMEKVGSDEDRAVKKESAQHEEAWRGLGDKVEMKIWRIEQFKVVEWPEKMYGKFYNGDSYIVYNCYKPDPNNDALAFDVHFWIGKYSTQDEYGTAAYKTVEVDTFLDDRAVQHREVEGFESSLFRSYFKTITIMEGGTESGFRHVEEQEYQPRLFHFKSDAKKNVAIIERPLTTKSLRSDDVFILDMGKEIFQWNGSGASKEEKYRAAQYFNELKSENSAEGEVLEEGDVGEGHAFTRTLSGEAACAEEEMQQTEAQDSYAASLKGKKCKKRLLRLTDSGGQMQFRMERDGKKINRKHLDTKDVFIFDGGDEVFVWVGSSSSVQEKSNGLKYAHKYLNDSEHPLRAVTVVQEGQHNASFNERMAVQKSSCVLL